MAGTSAATCPAALAHFSVTLSNGFVWESLSFWCHGVALTVGHPHVGMTADGSASGIVWLRLEKTRCFDIVISCPWVPPEADRLGLRGAQRRR